jgi:hypothetical protein
MATCDALAARGWQKAKQARARWRMGAMEVGHRAAGSPAGPRGDRGDMRAGRRRYASLRPILGGFKATRLCCRVAFGLPGYPGNSRGGWSADKTEPAVLFEGCGLLVVVGCGGGPARQRIRASSGVNRRALRGDVHAKGPWGCSAPQHSAHPSGSNNVLSQAPCGGRGVCGAADKIAERGRTRRQRHVCGVLWCRSRGRRWRRRVAAAAAFAVREARCVRRGCVTGAVVGR